MIIDAVRLPTSVEKGVRGGPMFNTSVLRTDGGVTSTNQNWTYPLYSGQAGYGIRTKEDMFDVLDFFYARRGRYRGFLFRDWSDYELVDEVIGTGDGSEDDFQIVRTYTDSISSFIRPISRPIEFNTTGGPDLTVKVAGVTVGLANWSLQPGGIIHLSTPPTLGQIVTVNGEFDIPVQFGSDHLPLEMELWNVGTIPQIPIIEVRE